MLGAPKVLFHSFCVSFMLSASGRFRMSSEQLRMATPLTFRGAHGQVLAFELLPPNWIGLLAFRRPPHCLVPASNVCCSRMPETKSLL